MGDWIKELAPTIIVGLIATLPGLIALFAARPKTVAETDKIGKEGKKVEAEANKLEAETEVIHTQVYKQYAELVDHLQTRVTQGEHREQQHAARIEVLESSVLRLQVDNFNLVEQVKRLAVGVQILTDQLISLGHKPQWTMEDEG